ncbi:DUF3781 domain-containing protein [Solobacterium moorei]|nr:DUF3781 domain-containing protein [Solobacterium moorei]
MVENKIENYAWRWCLVGNIVDKRFYGEEHEIKSGIKLFSPSTKVYIAPHQWGDGGDNLVVLGKPRHKKGLIECIIKSEHICNWRLQKIYPSKVLNRMNCSKYHWWGNDDDWKECIENYAKDVNKFLLDNPKILKNETPEEFLLNIDNMNTTPEGLIRIKESLNSDIEDVVEYCKNKIRDKNCKISREGKNWICITDDIKIIVNACGYTIIAAKKLQKQ